MSTNQPAIWSNVHYNPEAIAQFEQGISAYRILWAQVRHASNLVEVSADPKLADANIVFGQPEVAGAMAAENLRWIHLTTAGYTRFDTPEFRQFAKKRNLILTTSSSIYSEPCAQHVVAYIFAQARLLGETYRIQLSERSWNSLPLRQRCTLLGGQRVLIYGFGAIAQRVVELLAPLQLDIIGVRRQPSGQESVKTVTTTDAETLIGEADIIVNLLPANADSNGFFNAERISKMKSSALFINIGRGATVDQAALHNALSRGKLAAAYLDVATPEPLPPENPLWALSNCHITPHNAGGFSGEGQAIVQHFLENLRRFETGTPLADRVL